MEKKGLVRAPTAYRSRLARIAAKLYAGSMIDDYSPDGTGWARFSADRTMRYRLARSLAGARLQVVGDRVVALRRVVFLMLNPSDADAFTLDQTIRICIEFATRWGADVLEAVNLFALQSSKPKALYKHTHGMRGDDPLNTDAILAACTGAHRVVAAWGNAGNDPKLGWRANVVTLQLVNAGIQLMCLDRTQTGAPKHPHARGEHRIPFDLEPTVWA